MNATSPESRGSIAAAHGCNRRGSALFAVLLLAMVMAAVMAGLLTYVTHSARLGQRSNLRTTAVYAAEYAFERAYESLNTLVHQNHTALPGIAQTTAATNLATAPLDVFPAAAGYTWKSFLTVPVEGGVVVGAHSGFNATRGSYKFLTVVELQKAVPTMANPLDLQMQREWSYILTPLFQYAIFYNNDMELFPGANFVVGGRVHSNGRIYTGTSASISFADHVSHVDGVANEYHPLDPRAPGSPGNTINYAKGDPISTTREEPPGLGNHDTTDGNSNNDGPRELIEIPDFLHDDPNATTRLYTKAGLKVLVNTTGSDEQAASGVAVPANSRVFLTADGTTIPAADPFATYLNTMFATSTMRDYREVATVNTTDVDVSELNAGYAAGGLPQTIPGTANWPNNASVPATLRNQPIPAALQGKSLWNGILYVTDISHGATNRAGVKIINGTHLPDGSQASSPQAGLTVASENAAYIVGNYNTGGSPPVNSGSNLAASNAVAGYTVQPASVIADAVTIVSSNWTSGGYDGVASLNSRPATNTTVNTALISGIVASDGTSYSGGVENYLRLQENWSGRRLTYYGSIINLFESSQATAPWQNTGNYYNAPGRNWYFDVNFLDPNKLPPGTPILRSLKRGQWALVN